MKSFTKKTVRTLGFVCFGLAAASAQAVSPRAYLSVNGSDLNTCNVPTTPCRTYTGAISQTTPGGTVIVMDSGTFGGGTISQSVTINAPAGVLALAATPIIVNPGAGNVVVLRGLTFQAPVPGSGTAITQQSGTLFVENTLVDGWNFGLVSLNGAERLIVTGTAFRNHFNHGLRVASGSTATVAIDDSSFAGNGVGLALDGGSGRVSNAVLAANNLGANVLAQFTFQRCEISGNSFGLFATGSVVRVSHSTITRNGTGLFNNGGAIVESFGNNVISGNTTNTSGTITSATLQ